MFGSHLSIAGGLHNALLAAEALRLQTVQVFTRNQQQWAAPQLQKDAVRQFRDEAKRLRFNLIVAHDSYLINLAAGDEQLRQKSITALAGELDRCEQLGIAYLVTHGGSHGGAGETEGLRRIIKSLDQVFAQTAAVNVMLCLETTAGQGASLGWKFEHWRDVLGAVRSGSRLGVCLDTCHILAAGYDITTAEGIQHTMDQFDRRIGLDRLKVFHLNDSLKPLGSRVDRHTHIGHGHVGLPAFSYICRQKQFKHIPQILETPKDLAPNGKPWDEINLEILRKLAAGEDVAVPPIMPSDMKKRHPANLS